jgi:D-alanine-D-alanine ligase
VAEEARNIAVLMGGTSAERAVSLATGGEVAEALRSRGHIVSALDTADLGFIETLRHGGFEAVFICLHGRYGEDGTVQGLLDLLGLPYVGSGVLASALAMDKRMTRAALTGARLSDGSEIDMPAAIVLQGAGEVTAGLVDRITAALGSKTVVKPASEGSAIGVTIAHEPAELPAALEAAFAYDSTVIVEQYISGVEVTVGVLGNCQAMPLPTIEIVPEHEFYDYDSKYVPGMSAHIIPARISEDANARCAEASLVVHDYIGCRGMSRSDFIISEDGRAYFLEVNTIPGMTPTSLLPDAARAAGIEFPELCERLIALALEDR